MLKQSPEDSSGIGGAVGAIIAVAVAIADLSSLSRPRALRQRRHSDKRHCYLLLLILGECPVLPAFPVLFIKAVLGRLGKVESSVSKLS
jgi:hypothetical protein